MEITIQNEKEIIQKVIPLLLEFAEGDTFFVFEGEMAAGKTTAIKAFCHYLGVIDKVLSPTFSLVNEYRSVQKTLYHFDFYRIKDVEEVFDIGYEEYFYSGNYCLIEWGEKIESLLPTCFIKISIQVLENQSRKYKFIRKNHLN